MRPPILGFDPDPDDIDGCLRVAWRGRTVIATLPRGGILDAMHPEAEAELLAEQTEEARRDELRTLHTNVVLLSDYRRTE